MVSELQLSEEFINDFTVFTEAGKDALTNALVTKAHETEKAIAMYTCAPYTFVIGIYQEKLFLLDSHPIDEVLGSDGNGILLVSENLSVKSCKIVAQWILKRLQHSGTPDGHQSLAWVTKGKHKFLKE